AFKPWAYEKAAYAVEALDRPLYEIHEHGGVKALVTIPNIGKSIALKLEELLRTGRIRELDELRDKTPADVLELTRIEGCGPKAVKALYTALGIRSTVDLEAACRAGRVRDVPKFGERTERKFLAGIELLKRSTGRVPLGDALPLAHAIEER